MGTARERHGEPEREPDQGCGIFAGAQQDHRDAAGVAGEAEEPDRGAGAASVRLVRRERLSEGGVPAASGNLQAAAGQPQPGHAGSHKGAHHARKVRHGKGEVLALQLQING